MEERPPSCPRVAWEASERSQESSSVLEPFAVCEVEPLQSDASWLPVYEEEEEAVDFIKAFVKNPERDDVQKIMFLRNIVTVFTTAQEKGLLEGLDTFCRENKLTANIQVRGRLAGWGRWRGSLGIGQGCLGANIHGHPATPSGISGAAGTSALQGAGGHFWLGIPGLCQPCQQCWLCWRCVPVAARFHLICALQALLEEKPIDYPCTDLWEEAFLATSALSTVETVLEGEMLSLVAACVSSVFFLLRTEDLDAWFTMTILQKMDVMLRTLLIRPPASSLGDKLQSILKLLLEFTTSSSRAVQVNAAERIWNLFAFLYNCCRKEPFGQYLQPSQRTAIILKTLDIMSSYSTEDDEHFWAEFMVDIAVEDPATWLMDVPKILRFIHESLSNCRDSDHQKLFSVLSTMANQFPREVLLSILTDLPTLDRYQPQKPWGLFLCGEKDLENLWPLHRMVRILPVEWAPPSHGARQPCWGSQGLSIQTRPSTTLDIWKAMLSLPVTSEKILQELRNVLQDNEVCSFFAVSAVDLSIIHFTHVSEASKPANGLDDAQSPRHHVSKT
ncbi:uncharacterized protein [Anas acuta]|uniref:uncharacterized protein n=1 Tax=Anas acuta TaxID=28680 RepID=UPI0035C939C8